jgi:hypothetical protein
MCSGTPDRPRAGRYRDLPRAFAAVPDRAVRFAGRALAATLVDDLRRAAVAVAAPDLLIFRPDVALAMSIAPRAICGQTTRAYCSEIADVR